MSIDIYIKYSFQLVEEIYFIQGAEIEGFNTEHTTTEQGILYKIGFANPKYRDIQSLFINLEEIKDRIQGTLRKSIKGFPIWPWIIFLLVLVLLPGTLGKVIMYVNVVGIVLLFTYSVFKTIKYLYTLLKKTTTSYQGFTINYTQNSDTTFLNDELLSQLQTLKGLKITKVAYTGNCLYLYQEIKEQPKTMSAFFSSLFSADKQLSEAEKAALTQTTLTHLQQPAFLSLLMVSYA
ncbi:MAG: hypothetical protein LBG59_01355 [Candidatus Peribacteria bacterium]|nr:hypothetical protein [Candidatus Peribacteria bacterium]